MKSKIIPLLLVLSILFNTFLLAALIPGWFLYIRSAKKLAVLQDENQQTLQVVQALETEKSTLLEEVLRQADEIENLQITINDQANGLKNSQLNANEQTSLAALQAIIAELEQERDDQKTIIDSLSDIILDQGNDINVYYNQLRNYESIMLCGPGASIGSRIDYSSFQTVSDSLIGFIDGFSQGSLDGSWEVISSEAGSAIYHISAPNQADNAENIFVVFLPDRYGPMIFWVNRVCFLDFHSD